MARNYFLARREQTIKRLFDIACAIVGLAILWPLLLAVGLAIKISDPGPVFHRAIRVGKDGRLFRLYKFRTMVIGADKIGSGITTAQDIRVTAVGRRLRRTKIDELPQLINVLKGHMSIVGPRPEDPRFVREYTLEQRRVLTIRPGITGAASLVYRNEEQMLTGSDSEAAYREQIMPAKLKIELDYLDNWSIWLDIKLIINTVVAVLR